MLLRCIALVDTSCRTCTARLNVAYLSLQVLVRGVAGRRHHYAAPGGDDRASVQRPAALACSAVQFMPSIHSPDAFTAQLMARGRRGVFMADVEVGGLAIHGTGQGGH